MRNIASVVQGKQECNLKSPEHLNEKADSGHEMAQSQKARGQARARKSSINIVSNLVENKVPPRMSSLEAI